MRSTSRYSRCIDIPNRDPRRDPGLKHITSCIVKGCGAHSHRQLGDHRLVIKYRCEVGRVKGRTNTSHLSSNPITSQHGYVIIRQRGGQVVGVILDAINQLMKIIPFTRLSIQFAYSSLQRLGIQFADFRLHLFEYGSIAFPLINNLTITIHHRSLSISKVQRMRIPIVTIWCEVHNRIVLPIGHFFIIESSCSKVRESPMQLQVNS